MPEKISKEEGESAIANSDIKAVLTQVRYATIMLKQHPTLDQVIDKGSPFEKRTESRAAEIKEILKVAAREKYVRINEHGRYILTSKGVSRAEMSYFSGN